MIEAYYNPEMDMSLINASSWDKHEAQVHKKRHDLYKERSNDSGLSIAKQIRSVNSFFSIFMSNQKAENQRLKIKMLKGQLKSQTEKLEKMESYLVKAGLYKND